MTLACPNYSYKANGATLKSKRIPINPSTITRRDQLELQAQMKHIGDQIHTLHTLNPITHGCLIELQTYFEIFWRCTHKLQIYHYMYYPLQLPSKQV